MDVILFTTFSHEIIMTRKVDPSAEKGAGIFIQESSIKVIDAHRVLGKAQLIQEIEVLNRVSVCVESIPYKA